MEQTTALEPIIAALVERQETEGVNGEEFARRLRVTPATWSLVRRAERRAGRKLIDGALRLYPDLQNVYVQGLTIGNEIVVP